MELEGATSTAGVSAEEQAALAAAAAEQQSAEQEHVTVQALSPREEKLALVKANRKAEEEAERQRAIEQGLTAEQPGGNEQDGTADAAPASVPSGVVLKDGKWFTKLKVQGQEKLVPFDDVVRSAQKNEAADVRLQEASRRLAEAEQLRQKAELVLKQAAQPPSNSQGADGDDEVRLKAEGAVRELMEGDPKKAAKLLADLAATGRGNAATQGAEAGEAPTMDQILHAIEQREDLKAKREAVGKCFRDNPDIANNPVLVKMVDEHSALLLNDDEYGGRGYEDIMSEAVKRTRDTVRKLAGNDSPGITARDQRKGTVSLPGPGTVARRPAPAQPQPKTREQVLAEQRAARGQTR